MLVATLATLTIPWHPVPDPLTAKRTSKIFRRAPFGTLLRFVDPRSDLVRAIIEATKCMRGHQRQASRERSIMFCQGASVPAFCILTAAKPRTRGPVRCKSHFPSCSGDSRSRYCIPRCKDPARVVSTNRRHAPARRISWRRDHPVQWIRPWGLDRPGQGIRLEVLYHRTTRSLVHPLHRAESVESVSRRENARVPRRLGALDFCAADVPIPACGMVEPSWSGRGCQWPGIGRVELVQSVSTLHRHPTDSSPVGFEPQEPVGSLGFRNELHRMDGRTGRPP